ncbi:MAG TPA: TlpA disulfide reductase family protein [Gemmataceae bacterium]
MRVVPWVCLLTVGVALTGCKSAPKERPAPPASVPNGRSAAPFWADPNNPSRNPGTASIGAGSGTGSQVDPVSQPGNDPEVSGILAGKLVDGYGRPPGMAYVQVSLVRDGRADPIADVETVNQGHFYIRGLQPGRTYKLLARARQDGRVLVGEVQARPPETRLLIPLGEELAGANTPPIPTAPTPPKARPTSGPGNAPAPDAPWNNPAAGLGPPTAGGPAFGPTDQVAAVAPPGPPAVNIPTPVAPPATVAPIQPQSFTPAPPAAVAPPAVTPACYVSGGRVVTLRLPDADGREWDFSRRRGRLVLLDFWGTWCGPCLRAVPEVSRLHANYAKSGLEVVGVACERGSPADNARRVRDTRQRLRIPYELALADTAEQVQNQFHITHYPTLILVDADGTIAWRGGPDQLRELDGIIRRKLGY